MYNDSTKVVVRIAIRTFLIYLTASVATYFFVSMVMILTNVAFGVPVATRTTISKILATLLVFGLCIPVSVADGANYGARKEYSLSRFVLGNLFALVGFLLLALPFSSMPPEQLMESVKGASFLLFYLCVLPFEYFFFTTPYGLLLSLLVTLIPFTGLRIAASACGAHWIKKKYPSLKPEPTKPKQNWRDTVR